MRIFVLLLMGFSVAGCRPAPPGAGPVAAQSAPPAPQREPEPDAVSPSPAPEPVARARSRGPDPRDPRRSSALPVPVKLAEPPWTYTLFEPLDEPRAPHDLRLKMVSRERNEVIDTEAWFREVDWRPPVFAGHGRPDGPVEVADIPRSYAGRPLVSAWHGSQTPPGVLATYGDQKFSGHVLVVFDAAGEVRGALDLSAYRFAPTIKPGDRAFVDQELVWAEAAGNTVFVAHRHRTYAASSGGQNAYITAIDLPSAMVRWRSRPLVANAANFVVTDHHLITGYGFTAEPDFLYVLERRTGEIRSKVKVKSGPSYIFRRGDALLVRTYDRNYVFDLSRRPR